MKRREAKSKGEKERYKHLNAEFQRIARRDKTVINARNRGNNRVGKTSDLFKKLRDTKGKFHAKMGTIKDRNSMDLHTRLQQYVNREFPDVQGRFRKGRGTRDQIASICWIIEKAREFQEKHLFLLY